MSIIHVAYGGRNEDLEFDDVFREDRLHSLGMTTKPLSQSTNPETVKRALAIHYDVSYDEFDSHFVEVNPNGNITVRPNAKWGRG
jgi:hypothetical protein